ncbi:MAG: hypothetical protein MK008_10580 [Bdellovibrionales bacterium]|nr:hypothetical protein [Bdellovibrionales bacterium]
MRTSLAHAVRYTKKSIEKSTHLDFDVVFTLSTTPDNYKCMQLGLFGVISSDIRLTELKAFPL